MNSIIQRIIRHDKLYAERKIIGYLLLFNFFFYPYALFYAYDRSVPIIVGIVLSCMCMSYYSGVRRHNGFAIYIVVVSLILASYALFQLDNTVATIITLPMLFTLELIKYLLWDILDITVYNKDCLLAIICPILYLTPHIIGRYHRRNYEMQQNQSV